MHAHNIVHSSHSLHTSNTICWALGLLFIVFIEIVYFTWTLYFLLMFWDQLGRSIILKIRMSVMITSTSIIWFPVESSSSFQPRKLVRHIDKAFSLHGLLEYICSSTYLLGKEIVEDKKKQWNIVIRLCFTLASKCWTHWILCKEDTIDWSSLS